MDSEYLSIDEAATDLGVSRATMWTWLRRNETPTYKLVGDRRTLIKRSDLDRLRQPIPTEEAKKVAA